MLIVVSGARRRIKVRRRRRRRRRKTGYCFLVVAVGRTVVKTRRVRVADQRSITLQRNKRISRRCRRERDEREENRQGDDVASGLEMRFEWMPPNDYAAAAAARRCAPCCRTV